LFNEDNITRKSIGDNRYMLQVLVTRKTKGTSTKQNEEKGGKPKPEERRIYIDIDIHQFLIRKSNGGH
jgi:hypothetical protein